MRMYKIYMFTSLESRHTVPFRHIWHSLKACPQSKKCQKSLQARPTPTHGLKDSAAKIKDGISEDKNGQLVTKAICNKGFSGKSSILPRIKFRVGGQVSSPQTLTGYSRER